MRQLRTIRVACALGVLAGISGCASNSNYAARDTRLPAPQQLPEPVLATGSPAAAINRGIGQGETIWHLRSALNVAALSCRQKQENQIATNYNRMLRQHRAVLADAYSQEQNQFRSRYGSNWQGRQDRHMTSVYNFFANPVATRQFCAAAMVVSARINQLSTDQFKGYASPALAQLERPLLMARSLSRR